MALPKLDQAQSELAAFAQRQLRNLGGGVCWMEIGFIPVVLAEGLGVDPEDAAMSVPGTP